MNPYVNVSRPLPSWREGLPLLKGSLVSLREVSDRDAPTLFELLTDRRVTEHISAPPPTLGAFRGFIKWAQRERSLGNGVCFGIVPEGLESAVGVIQIRAIEPTSFFVAEWGFALGASFWGTGVFREAAALAATFALQTLHVVRLEGRVVSANGRGNGALQKVGGTAEAVLARAFKRGDQYQDQLLWSVDADTPAPSPDRFSADSARDRIRQAVAEAEATINRLRAQASDAPVPLYPFFVTDNRTKRS